jgi:hypothetical protein
MDRAASLAEATQTLVGACAVGARINRQELETLLRQADSVAAWTEYAVLGESETTFVLSVRPELGLPLAKVALRTAPRIVLPLLFQRAVGDVRPLAQNPDHPLRHIEDWVRDVMPGTNEGVHRRQILVAAASDWLTAGGDAGVVIHALSIALLPSVARYSPDPGSGMTITISRGLLTASEIRAVHALWPEVVRCLRSVQDPEWRLLLPKIEYWVYPERGYDSALPEDIVEEMRLGVTRMLSDLANIAVAHPGVMHRVQELASARDLDVEVVVDPAFELLFAGEPEEDWWEVESRRAEEIRVLAAKWCARPLEDVVQHIISLEEAARSIELAWPRRMALLCQALAESTAQPSVWVWALLDAGVTHDLIAPFLKKAADSSEPGWEDLVRTCLGSPAVQPAAIQVTLGHSSAPQGLIDDALGVAPNHRRFIQTLCLRQEITMANVRQLLLHADKGVAGLVAIAQWLVDPKGHIPSELQTPWRQAVVCYAGTETGLAQMLPSDPGLAHDWLRWHVRHTPALALFSIQDVSDAAIAVLDVDARKCILGLLGPGFDDNRFVGRLIGEDPELYESLLENPQLEEVWLAPLAGPISASWIQKARAALQRGIASEKVADALIFGNGVVYWGNESDFWHSKVDEFTSLLSHEDPALRAVGERVVGIAKARLKAAVEREKREAVYGRH